MTYIEVPRIQTHADKINSQLDCVLSERPQMYAKTKQRYMDLAISLLSSVEKIASILEIDSLASVDNKTSEFSSPITDVSNLSAALQHTAQRIDGYTSFVSSDGPSVPDNINKLTLKRYGKVLEEASKYNFRCAEASECAYILNKWFTSRFSNNSSTFKYNIAYLPQWITNIIILYGRYQSEGNSCSFVQMMSSWCDSLASDQCKWAVPYEVHQLSKQVNSSNYTMNAVLIGDILMDEVLYQLTDSDSPDIVATLQCYPVASEVKLKNPSLLPAIRTRLAKRDLLIAEYNLTITERRN